MKETANQLPLQFLDDDVTSTLRSDANDDIQPWISTKFRLSNDHMGFRSREHFKKKDKPQSTEQKNGIIKNENFRILINNRKRTQNQLEEMSSALRLRKGIPRFKTEQSKHTLDNRYSESEYKLVKCREIKPNLVDFRDHYDRTFNDGWMRKNRMVSYTSALEQLLPESMKPKTRAGGAALNTHLRASCKPERLPRKSVKLEQSGISNLMRITGIRFSLSSDKNSNLNRTHGFF